MPLTQAQMKTYLGGSGERPTIDADHWRRIYAWLDHKLRITDCTPDDLADYLAGVIDEWVLAWELGQAQDRVPKPTF